MGRILKLLIFVGIVFFAWKYVVPWAKKELGGAGTTAASSSSTPGGACVSQAQRASGMWGDGLGRFVNPPYDMDAWSQFRSGVDAQIGTAESACRCTDESCTSARSALSDLRGLVSEFDAAIRSGSAPPEDAVGRQERVDERLTAAAALVPAGR